MSTTKRHGSCVCGAVKMTADAKDNVGACHCGLCRRWGGGPFMTLECGTAVAIEGDENVSVFDSSEWAERGFCQRCGTHLFYRLKESREHFVPAGFFAADDALHFDHQVFIDEKPGFYSFANETQDMTGAEIFAKYGA